MIRVYLPTDGTVTSQFKQRPSQILNAAARSWFSRYLITLSLAPTTSHLVSGPWEAIEAGGRAYAVWAAARAGEIYLFAPPISCHYRCTSDSLLASRFKIPPTNNEQITYIRDVQLVNWCIEN
jgi:hypothetical protein